MIFQHTWEKVLSGEKTQRRLARYKVMYLPIVPGHIVPCYEEGSDECRFKVGKTYAVQPGRGKPAVWWRRNEDGTIEYTTDVIEYRPTFNGYHSEVDYSDLTRIDRRDFYRSHSYQPARILITNIGFQDVRAISDEDARAEGFDNRFEFWNTWVQIHDKRFHDDYLHTAANGWAFKALYTRDYENYAAWVLTFKLVQP